MMSEKRELIGSSKISPGKQVTIPKDVREILKKDSGKTIGFYLENGRVYIE
ncbi:MAG: AbrB/MazE/SpoVT family DNA-binding domain-containing protein [Candidatus Odinarchaeota archaeon]